MCLNGRPSDRDGVFMIRASRDDPMEHSTGRNNPFDWARLANQAAAVDCAAIMAIRAAGGDGGNFVPYLPCFPNVPVPSDHKTPV